MGSRTTIPIATLTLLTAVGCEHPSVPAPTDEATTAAPGSSPARALPVAPTGASATPPFRATTREVTALAASFVQLVVEYDSTGTGQLAFLRRVRSLATPAELDRLARSPRARLPWQVLRARAERTRVVVNGVSVESDTGDRLRVVVEAAVTTHTTFASVTGFRRFTLTLVPGDDRWLVDRAEGLDP
jgi:hypothetical protein